MIFFKYLNLPWNYINTLNSYLIINICRFWYQYRVWFCVLSHTTMNLDMIDIMEQKEVNVFFLSIKIHSYVKMPSQCRSEIPYVRYCFFKRPLAFRPLIFLKVIVQTSDIFRLDNVAGKPAGGVKSSYKCQSR